MNVALCCPGPSLGTIEDGYDLRIGVNRAVQLVPCHLWVFLDYARFIEDRPIGLPRIWTRATADRSIHGQGHGERLAQHNPAHVESLETECPVGLGWQVFTAPAALVVAAHLGATEIDVYGADWTPGAADFDGRFPNECNRSEERFSREKAIWGRVVEHLKRRGVSVRRVNEQRV